MTTVLTQPTIEMLLDGDYVGPALERLLQPDVGVAGGVSSRSLVWKPGSRALIAYRLAGDRSCRHQSVFGKHYARPVRAERVHSTWSALELIPFGVGAGVPELLGWCPDLSMVFYRPARGRSLDRLCRPGALEAGLRAAGLWLAALHRATLPLGRSFDLRKEVAAAADWAHRVAVTHPAHGVVAARLAADLSDAAPRIRLRHATPIHKDFHYQHVLLGTRLTVLDFDEMRMGDPRFDLAHFCTYLRLLEIRLGTPFGRRALERVFMGGYSAAPVAYDEVFIFFGVYTCLKIAKQLAASSGVEPRPAGREAIRQLGLVLDHGCELSETLRGRMAGGD